MATKLYKLIEPIPVSRIVFIMIDKRKKDISTALGIKGKLIDDYILYYYYYILVMSITNVN